MPVTSFFGIPFSRPSAYTEPPLTKIVGGIAKNGGEIAESLKYVSRSVLDKKSKIALVKSMGDARNLEAGAGKNKIQMTLKNVRNLEKHISELLKCPTSNKFDKIAVANIRNKLAFIRSSYLGAQIKYKANEIIKNIILIPNDKGWKVEGMRDKSIKYAKELAKSAEKMDFESTVGNLGKLRNITSVFLLCTHHPFDKNAATGINDILNSIQNDLLISRGNLSINPTQATGRNTTA